MSQEKLVEQVPIKVDEIQTAFLTDFESQQKTEAVAPPTETQVTSTQVDKLQVFKDAKLKNAFTRYQHVRNELSKIVEATEEVLSKALQKKQKPKRLQVSQILAEDPSQQTAEKLMKEQSGKIAALKAEVARLTTELEESYGLCEIKEKEDLLKEQKAKNSRLLADKSALEKTIKEYEAADRTDLGSQAALLDGVTASNADEALQARGEQTKQRFKALVQQQLDREKEVSLAQNKLQTNKMLLSQLQRRLMIEKQAIGQTPDLSSSNGDQQTDVERLEKELQAETLKREAIVKEGEEKICMLEKKKNELKTANFGLANKISEKNCENKTNSVKLRELKKIQRHNLLKPMDTGNNLAQSQVLKENQRE